MSNTTLPYERIEPDDLDLGEDVTEEVTIRRPTGVVISVQLTRDEADCLAALARYRGTGVVEAARTAILSAIQPIKGRAPEVRSDDPEGEEIAALVVEEET